MSLRRLAITNSGSFPLSTGSSASSSSAGAASGCIWAFRKSLSALFVLQRIPQHPPQSLGRPGPAPAAGFLPALAQVGHHRHRRLGHHVLDPVSREIDQHRLSRDQTQRAGLLMELVTPSSRATGIAMLAGSSPSATLNDGFTSPLTVSSWVSI